MENTELDWVVGIGASAGGLEAIDSFFTHCPNNLNVTFVVVQHLSSNYKSMMIELIHRYTSMPVKMIEPGMKIEKNTIFLIRPGTSITLEDNHFCVKPKDNEKLALPIDIFFKSLAVNSKHLAIAIILSGTGSDGSRGAIEVSDAGGLVIAQDPKETKFDGMPTSLIATGVVDNILQTTDMPKHIAEYLDNPNRYAVPKVTVAEYIETADVTFKTIIELLHEKLGIDFAQYKWGTFSRRLERRMQVKRVTSLKEYHEILRKDESEIKAMRNEQLIPVTRFFRDAEVFEELEAKIISELVAKADEHEGVRVWVAGVATGEEAYSLAMLFKEEIFKQKRMLKLKIFATDLNPKILDIASAASYPDTISKQIPQALLTRYFTKTESKFTVNSDIRQCIVFARHNLLLDPPFTKMDLVSCRNTLIYFKSKPQANAIQKLQYAVKEQCVLLLGKSESLTINTSHFEAIDAQLKLFRCIQSVKVLEFESVANSSISLQKKRKAISADMNSNMKSIIEHGQSLLQDKFVPTALLVNGVFDVVHFYGEPGVLFKYSQGPVSTNISHMLDRALVPIVTSLLIRLKKESEHVLTDNILTKVNEQSRNVTITAELLDNTQLQNYYLLTIEIQQNEINELAIQVDQIDDNVKKYISQLEEQLSATRESLQVTIEELETTNEELQATNEELMASNEELQSSNEELQSLNEELNTVNSEYHEKLNIVNQTNADLDALSKATAVATIFIDQDFRITRFTPDASKIFKLRNTDIGRPLEEIAHSLDYAFLHKDIQQTINTGQLLEKKVQSIEGKLYLVRLVDYRLSPIKSGLVISFVDVTALKISDQLNTVLDALPEHLAVLDRDGNIEMVNLAWERFAQHNGQNPSVSSVGQNYLAACMSEEADNKTNEAYIGVKSVLDGHAPRFCMEYPCHSPDEKRFFAMEVVAISHPQFAAVVSHFNISSWKNMEDEDI